MIMFYFSGTGNSRYIAELFSRIMAAECHSIEEDTDFAGLLAAQETVAFCYPIHGSRVPRIMREFALSYQELLRGKSVVILCTQLIFSGDGARAFIDIFPHGYFDVIYAEHILMPNNVCNLFLLPLATDRKVEECVQRAEQKVQKICREIISEKRRRRGFNGVSRALGLIQGAFYPSFERSGLDRVWIDGDCNECLLCISICPMHNIRYENGEVVAGGNCTICCRCINSCPQKAIAVYMHTKVKRQYKGLQQFPDELAQSPNRLIGDHENLDNRR